MERQPLVSVANAELCKEVGIKKFKHIRNQSTPPTMQSYMDALVNNIAGCPDQDCIPFFQLSLRMVIDIIGKTALGIEFGLSKNTETDGEGDDDDVREFLKEYKRFMEFIKMDLSSSLSTILGLFLPCIQTPCKRLLWRVPGMTNHKVDENERRMCRRIDAIIVGRRRERAAALQRREDDAPLDFIGRLHRGAAGEELLREVDSFVRRRAPDIEELHSRFPYLDKQASNGGG
ncbi:hypothetical protein PR202_ga31189 [Eleusine coracana subsp. coracana]|uniref:Uncharacterized protein n=1 Tax=Eleusine coracana subsp. coracana TaxID=191504 RepID=A0AAV5DRM9_ELECO|nr:hypothetical protein PR202_ga31189 [Eleusine coracana subsp. coracana]